MNPEEERRFYELILKEPSDQVGSRSAPQGWAGLWISDEAGGDIIVIQPDRSYDIFRYESEDELRQAWANFELALERKSPKDDDVIIIPSYDGMLFGIYRASDPTKLFEDRSLKKAVWYASRLLTDGQKLWLCTLDGEDWLIEPDNSQFEPSE